MPKLVYGLGFNDREHPSWVKGKSTDEYRTWVDMLFRCTEKCWVKRPAYVGTTCSEAFRSFSYFYEWYHQQPNAGRLDERGNKWQLDKDLLVIGNRNYSESMCVFVPSKINSLLTKSNTARGVFPIGVSWDKRDRRYRAQCNNEVGRRQNLGYFASLEEAFKAYKIFKEKLIKSLATEYKGVLDSRVYDALMSYTVTIND